MTLPFSRSRISLRNSAAIRRKLMHRSAFWDYELDPVDCLHRFDPTVPNSDDLICFDGPSKRNPSGKATPAALPRPTVHWNLD